MAMTAVVYKGGRKGNREWKEKVGMEGGGGNILARRQVVHELQMM